VAAQDVADSTTVALAATGYGQTAMRC